MAQFRLLKPRDLGDCAQSFPGGMPGSGVSPPPFNSFAEAIALS